MEKGTKTFIWILVILVIISIFYLGSTGTKQSMILGGMKGLGFAVICLVFALFIKLIKFLFNKIKEKNKELFVEPKRNPKNIVNHNDGE